MILKITSVIIKQALKFWNALAALQPNRISCVKEESFNALNVIWRPQANFVRRFQAEKLQIDLYQRHDVHSTHSSENRSWNLVFFQVSLIMEKPSGGELGGVNHASWLASCPYSSHSRCVGSKLGIILPSKNKEALPTSSLQHLYFTKFYLPSSIFTSKLSYAFQSARCELFISGISRSIGNFISPSYCFTRINWHRTQVQTLHAPCPHLQPTIVWHMLNCRYSRNCFAMSKGTSPHAAKMTEWMPFCAAVVWNSPVSQHTCHMRWSGGAHQTRSAPLCYIHSRKQWPGTLLFELTDRLFP